jgi:hypothetical protein
MTSKQKVYVTTSIPYVNSKPHIGHALELIQADVIVRHYRLSGSDVVFQTGTDENAFKNVLAARQQGITTEELVDKNAGIFRSLVERLNISTDIFIRTTEERHKRGVVEFWNGSKGMSLRRRGRSEERKFKNGADERNRTGDLRFTKAYMHQQLCSCLSAFPSQFFRGIFGNRNKL